MLIPIDASDLIPDSYPDHYGAHLPQWQGIFEDGLLPACGIRCKVCGRTRMHWPTTGQLRLATEGQHRILLDG